MVRDANPPLARRVRGHIALAESDLEALERLSRDRESAPAGAILLKPREGAAGALLVQDGWAMCWSSLPTGRRQIVSFVLPGDMVGLTTLILGHSSEFVSAITPVTVSRLRFDAIEDELILHSGLRRALFWTIAQEATLRSDRLVSLGRRSALERVARILLEITLRLRVIQDDPAPSTGLPLTQPLLADAAGLSQVHVNRTLKTLRAANLIRGRRLLVDDLRGLARVANVAPGEPLYPLLDYWVGGLGVDQ